MKDEIHIIEIVHGGNPRECRRCKNSTRPPCPECGHALSGAISNGSTTCEFCGKIAEAV